MRTWVLLLFCVVVIAAVANAQKKVNDEGEEDRVKGKGEVEEKKNGKRNGNRNPNKLEKQNQSGRNVKNNESKDGKGPRKPKDNIIKKKSGQDPKKNRSKNGRDRKNKSPKSGQKFPNRPRKVNDRKKTLRKNDGNSGNQLKKKLRQECPGKCVDPDDCKARRKRGTTCDDDQVCCLNKLARAGKDGTTVKRFCKPLTMCSNMKGECRKKKKGCNLDEKRYKNKRGKKYCDKNSCYCCVKQCKSKGKCMKLGGSCMLKKSAKKLCDGDFIMGKKYCKGKKCGCCVPGGQPCKQKKTCTKEGGSCVPLGSSCSGEIKTVNSKGKAYCKGSCGCCLPVTKPTTIKPKPTTIKPKPTTIKPKPTTIKPKPTTIKPKPTTIKPKPTTIKPKPTTIKPKTTTVKPKPTTNTVTNPPKTTESSTLSTSTTVRLNTSTTTSTTTSATTTVAMNSTITSTPNSTNQTTAATMETTPSPCNISRAYCNECGAFNISVADYSRIVNGSDASPNEFPYQVAVIAQFGNGSGLCGGSIIKRRWVLCAAHCLVNNGVRADGATIRIGDIDINEAKILTPSNFTVHENYDGDNFANDIALLELAEDFNFTDPSTQPICIAEESDIPFGGKAVATGWGQIYTDGPISLTLREVALDIINNTLCEELFVLPPEGEKAVCAFTPYKGTCHGDSGGPLVAKLCNGRWVVFGVVSYGSIFGCAHPDIPTVFTRVSAYRSWIDRITGSETLC